MTARRILRQLPLPLLLLGTAALYLWNLGASGWANPFYSAAAQAGSASWKALFFGSSDAANFITVDKTPASLWLMGLSVKLFGLNSWSILVPQALAGIGSVWLLYAAVRRWHGQTAGLIAGAALALTPVAALMFRFNNPDALLVLLLVAAAYATVRAVERASVGWLMAAGAFVGFGFLTKMLQAFLVVPALGLAYLVAAPVSLRRRLGHLAAALGAMTVAGGWWVAIVELWPASSRPYIGGTQGNSILELALGYNGIGRLNGDETGSVGGGMGWGQSGLTRLFDGETGGQAAWLLPAALILLGAGLWLTWRLPRTDRTRASLILWGGWLLVTGLTFSLMQGIFHAYYTVALAPAIGALVGIGAVSLVRHGTQLAAGLLAATVAVTAVWAYVLLGRSADFLPWLRTPLLLIGLAAAVALAFGTLLTRRLAVIAAVVAVIAGLAGPAAYALDTAGTAHSGAIPSAGPSVSGGFGGGFGGGSIGGGPGGGGGAGAFGDGRARPDGGGLGPAGAAVQGGAAARDGGRGRVGGGGMGGLLGATTPSAELVAALTTDAGSFTWIAATVGSNNAAGYQLATGKPVMAVGGFNGTDAAPTLAQFQAYVAAGQVHYWIGGSGFRSDSGSDNGQQIADWVAATFPSSTVGGVTIYDLA